VPSGPPTVSLLMPNRNNGGILDEALSKLAENTTYPNFELIVVDDGSTDSSRQILRRWRDSGRFRSLTVLEKEHRGVQASLNTAAEAASGELLAQMDGDATLETAGWLERLVGFLESDPRVGVVTPAVILGSGRVHAYGVNIIGPEGLHDGGSSITEPVGRRTLHSAAKRPRAAKLPPPPAPVEVDASIGCCMLFRRELYDEMGGFDEGFAPVWFEDLDMSLGARRLGTKVFLIGDVSVLHQGHLAREDPGLARRAGRHLPQWVKDVIGARTAAKPSPAVRERLSRHYAHWREKWGFDLLNPDMEAIFSRYGDSEVCWRYRPEMREAGEQIAAGHAGQPAPNRT
jgi:glycosyltransferase involved in cell wall biosynthesis